MRYAIIGAGLAGLTAAVEIRRADEDADIDIFEATGRIGGKLHTVPFDAGRTDVGAEAFLARRQDAVEYFESLGLGEEIVYPSGMHPLVYTGGEAKALPKGGVMGIPSSSAPVAHLVSDKTAARIDAEATATPIDWEIGGDVSVGKLVRERYGDEVVDHIVSALLGGVYSCLADDLGLRATIPQLAEALDELAEAGEPVTLSRAVARIEAARPAPTDPPAPVFGTFRGGYAQLYETLAEKSGADIYLDAFISAITRDNAGFRITGGAEAADKPYDRLLIATPAPTAGLLTKNLSEELSTTLKTIQLADSVVVAMRFPTHEGLPDNTGVLVATDEPGLHAKAFTFSSKKWPHLANMGGALVRASFGRFGDNTALRTDEDTLVDYALEDLRTVTGFDTETHKPEEIYTQRWFGGLPRYDETHLATVAKIRKQAESVDGLELTGAWAGGVGVPAVIADARAAGRRVVGG
ncbi:protoporphyrinogen oxidase [Corynebacterium yudongzhengii]|uniref:Coproporphyrinogen III oxidase n=1 Tax=Corynebacterium yudongzhengii TaxID=2080740 RepID=A0A2U1T9Y3_9CORY|nr:protoporphyrinogen oxidase [Corynebacterium yudongzhengii]AWB81169.1 protoporphyrinogen oxidase [Corynebacterium yudongzhengii]PWC02708.1 protoporphyrinogen oxidase [Corynebacterium yudongzhengii]